MLTKKPLFTAFPILKLVILTWLIAILTACTADDPITSWPHSGLGSYDADIAEKCDYALVATVDHGTQLWDLEKEQSLFLLSHHAGLKTAHSQVALAKTTPLAVTCENENIVVWNTKTAQSLAFWQVGGRILDISLSYDGIFALVGLENTSAQLIDLRTGISLRTFEQADNVKSVALSEDGRYALIGSHDKSVRLWDLNTGLLKQQWFYPYKITMVKISPSSKYILISSAQKESDIFSVETGKKISELKLANLAIPILHEPYLTISSATFSPDEKYLYTGTLPRHIRKWDIETGQRVKQWVIPNRKFWRPTSAITLAIKLHPDNESFLIESSNGMGYRFAL